MTEGQNEIDTGAGIPPSGPGRLLREGRTSKGLSIRDVADALHLTAQTVENMEADRYEQLPPATFVKGYLRSYAKLVDIKPYMVMAAFDQLGLEEEHQIVVRKPVRTSPEFGVLGWLLIVGVAVVAGVLSFYWNQGELIPSAQGPSVSDQAGENTVTEAEDNTPPPQAEVGPEARGEASTSQPTGTEPTGTEPAENPNPNPNSNPAPKPTPAEQAQASAETQTTPASDSAPASTPPPASNPAQTPSAPTAEPPATATAGETGAEAEAGSKELVLHFSGPSWMEVRDAHGRRLLYQLVQESGDRTLRGVPPFSLVVGAPGAVSADLEGKHYAFPDPGHVLRTQIPLGH